MNQISGKLGLGQLGGGSRMNIHARWVGPSAWLQGEWPTCGTSVRWALRPVGRACHWSGVVGLKLHCMKPSSPGSTLASRLSCGLFNRTVVPSVPPGTSSAPTSVASRVRDQQASKAPQPLLTVLPSVTATGRCGRVWPSISMVWPMQACSRYSSATRRIVAAGTSQTPCAHSGEYPRIASTVIDSPVRPWMSLKWPISPSGPCVTACGTGQLPSSASCAPGVSKGTARALSSSHTSGLRDVGSRR